MRDLKRDKIEVILQDLAAKFILVESTPASLITVTRVELNPSGKDARIFFTTLPEDKQETAQKFLDRKGSEFVRFVRDHSKIGILPHLSFKIDYGERNRQRIDEISRENIENTEN